MILSEIRDMLSRVVRTVDLDRLDTANLDGPKLADDLDAVVAKVEVLDEVLTDIEYELKDMLRLPK